MKVERFVRHLTEGAQNSEKLRAAGELLGNELPRHRVETMREARAAITKLPFTDKTFEAGYAAALADVTAAYETAIQDPDDVAQVRALLKQWEDGHISLGEFGCRVHDLFLTPFLECMERGDTYMRIGSCCCSAGHPPDRTLQVEITIQPHGFTAKQKS